MKVLLVTLSDCYGRPENITVLPREALHGRTVAEFKKFLTEEETDLIVGVTEIDLSLVELWRYAPACPHIGRRDDA